MRASEINHGDHFSCRIQGRSVSGRINKEHNEGAILLCNNIKVGRWRPAETFGKDGAWAIPLRLGLLDFNAGNVTDFVITKRITAISKKAVAKKAAANYIQQTVVRHTAETPTQKVSRLKREIEQIEREEQQPGSYKTWRIMRAGNTFTFGCGEVQLTRTQLEGWIAVQKHLNRRVLGSTSVDGSSVNGVNVGLKKQDIVDALNYAMRTAERIVKVGK